MNGQSVVDNVDFAQNVKGGVGVVQGTLETFRTSGGSKRLAARGTLVAVWQGDKADGQIVIRPVGKRGIVVLNGCLDLRTVAHGTAVDITFGRNPRPHATERERVLQRDAVLLTSTGRPPSAR